MRLVGTIIVILLATTIWGCSWSTRFQPARDAYLGACDPVVVEAYFRDQPMQSALFQRGDMARFISQFAYCKHEFTLEAPTFETIDGRAIGLPYRITIDTTNTPDPAGCIRRETISTIPIKFVTYCFDGDSLVEADADY